MKTSSPRNILLVTTDQQRYDALGCNGGTIARTPVVDRLAAEGLRFTNARNNNVVCMPSRVSLLTGQHPLTHGVVANGIPYNADDGTSLAHWLKRRAGYQTALVGKAHFDPGLDLTMRFRENQLASEGSTGPWVGFDFVKLSHHGPTGHTHYSKFIMEEHPHLADGFATVLMGAGGGDTGAPEVAHNPIPREFYHTDWVAQGAKDWLDTCQDQDPFFLWMSFPDPHHPFDPPASELGRVNWRDLDLPPGHPGSREDIEKILSKKPAHWLAWYKGKFRNPEGGPSSFRPCQLSADQMREMTAMIHIQNELMDEALGSVLDHLKTKNWLDNTDIFFTTDHGDLQGDFGLFFKGPYMVDSLMHLPFIWKPAKSANTRAAVVQAPVSQVDFFPTACAIAGVPIPPWVEGRALPTTSIEDRPFTLNSWDSQFATVGMHLRSIFREDWTLTAYLPSTKNQGGRFPLMEALWGAKGNIPKYRGGEGELYNLKNDPHQWENLWDDPSAIAIKKELLAILTENFPKPRTPALKVAAPT